MDLLPWCKASHRLIELMENNVNDPKLSDELRKMEYEPLLPVEKKLILWSVGLGIVLLALLIWLSSFF